MSKHIQMLGWLQSQSQKAPITEADMQRSRLGVGKQKLPEAFDSRVQVMMTGGTIRDPITGKLINKNPRQASQQEINRLGFNDPHRPGGPTDIMNQSLSGTQAAIDRGGAGLSPTGGIKFAELNWAPFPKFQPLRFAPMPNTMTFR